jgi:hypothetical protein
VTILDSTWSSLQHGTGGKLLIRSPVRHDESTAVQNRKTGRMIGATGDTTMASGLLGSSTVPDPFWCIAVLWAGRGLINTGRYCQFRRAYFSEAW